MNCNLILSIIFRFVWSSCHKKFKLFKSSDGESQSDSDIGHNKALDEDYNASLYYIIELLYSTLQYLKLI